MSNVIQLVDVSYSMYPEGKTVFKVKEVDYNSKFGKVEIHLVDKAGKKHTEKYNLKNGKKVNEGATKAFSFFAKLVMGDMSLDAVDPDDLVGRYFATTVEHVESDALNDDGEPYVNVRLQKMKSAKSFGKGADVEDDEDEDDEDLELDIDDEDDVDVSDDEDDEDDWLD